MGYSTATLILGFVLYIHSGFSVCDESWSISNVNEERALKASKCLASIRVDESAYKDCMNNSTTCFIFIGQEPYIEMPDSFEQLGDLEVTSANNQSLLRKLQSPFRCEKPDSLKMDGIDHPDLGGAVFDVFKLLIENISNIDQEIGNYACMWGGPVTHCKFNALVDFISIMDGKGYHFAIANYLVELPERACNANFGRPLASDTISVVAHDTKLDSGTSLLGAAKDFTARFDWRAFLTLIFLFLLIFTCAGLVVRFISAEDERKWSFKRILMVLYGNTNALTGASRTYGRINEKRNNYNKSIIVYDDDDMGIHRNNISSSHMSRYSTEEEYSKSIIVSSLHASLVSLVAIMVLFYEIGVVDDVLIANINRLKVDLKELPDKDWKHYCINDNSAVESVMIHYCKLQLLQN